MSAGNPLENQARDPHTDQQTLYRLAAEHPELRPLIASNPNTYPALLEWLGGLGDPVIDAALAVRDSVDEPVPPVPEPESSVAEADETVLMAPPVTPAQPPVYQPAGPGPVVQRNTVMPKGYSQGREPVLQQPVPVAAPATMAPIVPGFPAAQQDPFPSPVVEPKRNGGLIAAFVALGFLALVAAGVVIYILMGGGSPSGSEPNAVPTTPQATSVPTEASTPSASASPSESPTPEETKFPAPPGAVSATWFASPSGNLVCQMGGDGALCTVLENDYRAGGYADCDGGTVSIRVGQSGAEVECSAAPVQPTADILVFNTASTVGDFACLSTQNGMTCWNTASGESFALSRYGWIVGQDGAIPENQFPWVQ